MIVPEPQVWVKTCKKLDLEIEFFLVLRTKTSAWAFGENRLALLKSKVLDGSAGPAKEAWEIRFK